MEVELFTLADYAIDNGGKLTVVGSFDSIFTQTFPTVHPSSYLALKFRVANSEAGVHNFQIIGKDPSGKEVMRVDGTSDVKVNPNYGYNSSIVVIPLFNIKFEMAGRYTIELSFDGEFRSGLSLHIVQVPIQLGKAA